MSYSILTGAMPVSLQPLLDTGCHLKRPKLDGACRKISDWLGGTSKKVGEIPELVFVASIL